VDKKIWNGKRKRNRGDGGGDGMDNNLKEEIGPLIS
jgi:hypothetical protein